MNADAFAGPGLFTLFAAIPVCCVLTGLGRRGAYAALVLSGVVVAANLAIAFNVSEYGDFGAGVVALTGFFTAILLLISWHIGGFIREERSSPGKR